MKITRNHYYFLGALLLVGFSAFTLVSFTDALTPYVTYEQAREKKSTVQVAGELEDDSTRYAAEEEALYFTLVEPESRETLRVRYHGLKPANFEEAVSIVAIGRYDLDHELMVADKLLVKCPSKYQGAEVETKTYSAR